MLTKFMICCEGRSLILNSKLAIQKAVPQAFPPVQAVARGPLPARLAGNNAECRASASLLMYCSRHSQFSRSGIYSAAMSLSGGLPAMPLYGPCSSGSQSRWDGTPQMANSPSQMSLFLHVPGLPVFVLLRIICSTGPNSILHNHLRSVPR